MAVNTKPSLAAIYGSINSDTGELVGSGTFLNLHGHPYLITARHVALESKNYIGLAHSRSDAHTPAYISHPFNLLNDHIDICLVRIEADTLRDTAIVPLNSSKISRNSSDVNEDVLFIHGYPDERSKPFKSIVKGVVSKTLPYGTVTGKSSLDWFDDRVHFALDYSADNLIHEKYSQATHIIPKGLSGSAVWKTNQRLLATPGNPTQLTSGVVHHWDQTAQSLSPPALKSYEIS